MKPKRRRSNSKIVRCYSSPNIPMAVIRRYSRQIAERFHPDKIILFGSYAYGHTRASKPAAASRVILLGLP